MCLWCVCLCGTCVCLYVYMYVCCSGGPGLPPASNFQPTTPASGSMQGPETVELVRFFETGVLWATPVVAEPPELHLLMLRIPSDAVEPTQLSTCLSGSLTAMISPGSFWREERHWKNRVS